MTTQELNDIRDKARQEFLSSGYDVADKNGRPLSISCHEVLFLQACRERLTPGKRAQLMGLDEQGLKDAAAELVGEDLIEVRRIMASQPYYHETGEPLPLDDADMWAYAGVTLAPNLIRARIKSGKIDADTLSKIHSFLTSDEIRTAALL